MNLRRILRRNKFNLQLYGFIAFLLFFLGYVGLYDMEPDLSQHKHGVGTRHVKRYVDKLHNYDANESNGDNGNIENQNVDQPPLEVENNNRAETERKNQDAKPNINQPPLVNDDKPVMDPDTIMGIRQERYLQFQNRGAREGPGENGQPVTMTTAEAAAARESMRRTSINLVASNKVDMDRSLPDYRREE